MTIPSGAQISEDGDHYHDGDNLVEIDLGSAVELHSDLGVARYSGDDGVEWRAFFQGALQGTTAHSGMRPAAQVRLASSIADHMMEYTRRAREGFVAARDELNADPNTPDEVKTQLGITFIGTTSTWGQSAITSLGSYAQSSTDAEHIARQVATLADEAFHQDLGDQNPIWQSYNRHRHF